MDSPLLPTHRTRPQPGLSHSHLAEDPSLLADLSIEEDDDSFLPSSPIRPSSSRSQLYPQPSRPAPTSRPGSASSSHTDAGFRARQASSSRSGSISGGSAASHDEDTPQKPAPGRAGTRGGATSKPRFSLFAPPRPPSAEPPAEDHSGGSADGGEQDGEGERDDEEGQEDEDEEAGEEGEDQTIHAGAGPSRAAARPVSTGERDDKLRESLYELRRMNEVFEGFLGALEAARGHNERLAVRVKQTSALLDQYTALLGQAEHTQKLLSNPNWTGAADDNAAIEAERIAAEEAEEARLQALRDAEEAAQRAEEEKERRAAEAERAKEAGRGTGTRGRGGTRRGIPRGRGSGIPTAASSRTGSKTPTTGIRRPTPSYGTAGTGGSAAGTGTGTGKYGHVASSGYGPPSRK